MVATSFDAAQSLVKMCELSQDASRAHLGILIGGSSTIHVLEADELVNIERILNEMSNNGDVAVPQFAIPYRSALRPLQKAITGGTFYKKGDTVLASQGNGRGHVILKVRNFYLLSIEAEYVPVVIGDLYRFVRDARDSSIIRHPLSDSVIVQPAQKLFGCHIRDLKRKLMLYPYNQGHVIIDPDRTLKLPHVVVPVYPKPGDMAIIKGDGDEIWRAEVRSVDEVARAIKGYFFIKHSNWDINFSWKRESMSRRMDTISFKSIVGLANGEWQGPFWKDS